MNRCMPLSIQGADLYHSIHNRTEFKHGGLLLLRGIIRYIKGQLPVSPSAKDDVIVSRMYQMSMVYRREKSRE